MEVSYKEKKVLSIDVVSELTELSNGQILDYEERKLIVPACLTNGTRKYSFADIERLIKLSNQITNHCSLGQRNRKKLKTEKNKEHIRDEMILGQLNAAFGCVRDRYSS